MRIGIYPRKSVYRDNSDSVSVQVALCKEYAGIIYKDQPLEFRIYDKDEGFSGKNTNRPSFQELMKDVTNNALDVVMVYKLSAEMSKSSLPCMKPLRSIMYPLYRLKNRLIPPRQSEEQLCIS